MAGPWLPGDPPDTRMGTAGAPAPGGGLGLGGSKGGVNSWGSTLGNIGSIAGLFAGPAGMAFGPVGNLTGSWIDANTANRGLATQGLSRGVSAVPAALSNGLFGLMGRMGIGTSIADQVGAVKSEAARADPRFGGAIPASQTSMLGAGTKSWATDPMNFDQNSPTKDFGPGGFGTTGADTGGGISTSGGQSPGEGGKGDVTGGGDKGAGGGGWSGGGGLYAGGGIVHPPMRGAQNPPGPDDQFAGLQTGEGVISRANMQAHPALAMLVQRLMRGGL